MPAERGLLARLFRPEYLFRPRQLARRLVHRRPPAGPQLVRLPWGLDLEVRGEEAIGRSLLAVGVYDLTLTESLWRLTMPDDLAVDGGANVGYASAVLAWRAGRVVAFEPHPVLAPRLEANVARWRGSAAPVEVRREALGESPGPLRLVEGDAFAHNEGTARIAVPGAGGAGHQVMATTMDAFFDTASIGVLKLDVEGYESQVLAGATSLLARHAVRDIVYEDHDGYPSPVAARLEAVGYRVLALGRSLLGPRLDPPSRRPGGGVEAPNYLATIDVSRAERVFKGKGWRSLR